MSEASCHTILLAYNLDGEYETEAVEATEEGQHYRLISAPFFAKHLAIGDVVSVEDEDGCHWFDDIVRRSGHSTIRIVFFDQVMIGSVIDAVIGLGATMYRFESSVLFVADVAPTTDYAPIRHYLDDRMAAGVLDYEEACLGWK